MFQDYISFTEDLLTDMGEKLSPGAIDNMSLKVNELLHMNFYIGRTGMSPVTASLEDLLQEQSIRDLQRANDMDLRNLFINGFPGYKGMSLREFLKCYIMTAGNITFMHPTSYDVSELGLQTLAREDAKRNGR